MSRAHLIRLTGALVILAAGCRDREIPRGQLTPEVLALLAHVPADARLVAGLSLSRARQTGFEKLIHPRLAALVPAAVTELKAGCGLDLVDGTDTLLASVSDDPGDRAGLTFVLQGKVTRERVADCLARISTSEAPFRVEAEGALTAYTGPTGKTWVAWPAPDVLVASGAAAGSAERLSKLAGGGGAAQNAALMSLIGKADTGALFWAAGPLPSSLRSLAAATPIAGVFMMATPAGDGVQATLGVVLTSEDVARSTAEALRGQKDSLKQEMPDPMLGDIIGRMEIVQTGVNVAAVVKLSGAELEHLMGLANMLPLP